MRLLSRCLVVALALLLLAAIPAAADIITFDLTIGNSALSGTPGPYATVKIERFDATHATVTVTMKPTFTLGGEGLFALNLKNTNVTASGIDWTGGNAVTSIDYTICASGCPPADFGNFTFTMKGFDGRGASVSSLTFNMTLTSGAWATVNDILVNNGEGYFARGHIFGPGVTGYAVNGETPTQTPEPASLALLGAGLVGLGGWWRRRR